MRSFILLAALIAVAYCADTYSRDRRPSKPTASYGVDNKKNDPYGRNSHDRRGYNPFPAYYPPPPPKNKDNLDELDQLFFNAEAVLALVQNLEEQLGAAEAEQSRQKSIFDELVFLVLDELTVTDDNQDAELDMLEARLDALEARIQNELRSGVDAVESTNTDNLNQQVQIENLLTDEARIDIEQDGDIAEIVARIADFRARNRRIKENEVELLEDLIERTEQDLQAVRDLELSRFCEVGEVTLDGDDLSVYYQFQNDFGDQTPQILLGITAYKFDLQSREDDKLKNPYHVNYYDAYPPKEPGQIGLRVGGYGSPVGVNVNVVDLSFNQPKLEYVTVSIQACSSLGNPGPVEH